MTKPCPDYHFLLVAAAQGSKNAPLQREEFHAMCADHWIQQSMKPCVVRTLSEKC